MEKSQIILGALQKLGMAFDFDNYEQDSNYKAADLALDRVYENVLSDKNLLFNVKPISPTRTENADPIESSNLSDRYMLLYEYSKPLDFRGLTWSNYEVYEKGPYMFSPKEYGLQIDYLFGGFDLLDLPGNYLEYMCCRLALEISTPLNKTKNLGIITNVMQIEYDKLSTDPVTGPIKNIDMREVL